MCGVVGSGTVPETTQQPEGSGTVAAMKPLGKIKDTALDTIKHPLGTTQKAVGVAVGTARGAAQGVAHGVSGLLPGRKPDTSESVRQPAEKRAAERKVHGDPVAPKTPTRKPAAAQKTATKKAPAQKGTRKKRPAEKSAGTSRSTTAEAPLTAAEVAAAEGADVTTPAGTTAADVGTNPDTTDTGLEQPGTEPLVDPATVKAVASEAETLQKGADPDKG